MEIYLGQSSIARSVLFLYDPYQNSTPLLSLECIYIMAASPDSELPAAGMIVLFLIPELSMAMCL